jgi:hypothetical protein
MRELRAQAGKPVPPVITSPLPLFQGVKGQRPGASCYQIVEKNIFHLKFEAS